MIFESLCSGAVHRLVPCAYGTVYHPESTTVRYTVCVPCALNLLSHFMYNFRLYAALGSLDGKKGTREEIEDAGLRNLKWKDIVSFPKNGFVNNPWPLLNVRFLF